jgi:DNA-binding GntR family transcriptional regulator
MASSPHALDIRVRPSTPPYAKRGLTGRHRVRLALHERIVSGAIPGGTRLVQSVIAEEFSAGTRQVREALRDLAAQGFVRIDARGGAIVQGLSRGDLEDIYQMRMLLEPTAAARSAVHASEDIVLCSVRLLAAMESETDAGQWTHLDSSFHRFIGEASDSPRLAAALEDLREQSARYVQHSILALPERTRESGTEHEAIMRAILKGDPDAAADAMFRHLDGTLSALRVRGVRPRVASLTR